MANNPFYIDPNPTGVNIGGQLAQLGQTLGNVRKQDEQKQQQQQVQTGLKQVIATGDTDKMADFAATHPDVPKQQLQQLNLLMKSKHQQHQQAIQDRSFELLQHPDDGHKIFAAEIQKRLEAGATKEELDPLIHQMGAYDADPKGYIKKLNVSTAITFPDQYKSYKSATAKPATKPFEQGKGVMAGYAWNPNTGKYSISPDISDKLKKDAQAKIDEKARTNQQLKPTDISTINSNLNNQILKQPVSILESASALSNLKLSSSPAAQKAAVVHFLKALDPAGVVRETEEGGVYSSGGKFPQLEGEVNNWLKGGKLSPDVFQDIVETSKNLANSSLDSAREASSEYINTYGDYISPNRNKAFMKRVPENFKTDRLYNGSKYVKPEAVAFTSTNPKIGDVTEDDIHVIMKKHNLTRDQVIGKLKGGK